MIKIGLIGEYPTDIYCIITLLKQKFNKGFNFFPLLYDVNGSSLDEPSIKHKLRREYQIESPHIVIFIRDLDAPRRNKTEVRKRKKYFSNFNTVVDKKGVLLLNIQELEAILLSDITILNKYFSTEILPYDNCELVPSPKDEIKRLIPDYSTGKNIELFKLYNYDVVVNNCKFFEEFNTSLLEKIN